MQMLEAISPVKFQRTRQAAPQVFESLRELIVSVELKPGTVLRRAALAEHYGVSQTPIRDALQRLSEEGLVDIYAQHASIVSRIDTAAALQMHFLRRSLELEILKTLCGLPQSELTGLIARLRQNLKQQARTLAPLDYAGLAVLDMEFHHAMYEAAGVGSLWDLVRQRNGHIDRLRRLNLPKSGKAKSVVSDHQAIAEALEQRDAHAAEQALRTHLGGTLSFIDEIKTRFPEFVV